MPALPSTLLIPEHLSGCRLDVALAELLPDYSRSRLKQWVQEGRILLDGQPARPRAKVFSDQKLELNVPVIDETEICQPEDIKLDVVYEDEALIVINKPAGLVVHPAAGHQGGTLQNALLFYDESLVEVPRCGIVHRLDKDTSGLMVVARTLKSHKYLVEAIMQRQVSREYQAIVFGVMTAGGTVDQPIGRHPQDRKRMAIRNDGKPAVSHYRVLERFRHHTHVQVKLETGRTHQIRVHMQHLRYPIVGDPVYAGRLRLPGDASPGLRELLQSMKRQALHAWRLTLNHPGSGEEISWQAALPEDMQLLIEALNKDREDHE